MISLGVIAFAAGFTHRLPEVSQADVKIFLGLHQNLRHDKTLVVFRLLWPFGTTPFTIIIFGLLAFYDWRLSLSLIIVYSITLFIERLVKIIIWRPRPFLLLEEAHMLQPHRPSDSSFPSGDAMRVWFLALTIPQTLNLNFPLIWITLILATIVSLGRIALGVHYPLDVLSGVGLGWTAAVIWSETISLI